MTKAHPDDLPWVFVSHASADLPKVRQVRNFMEEKGAAPILFHLKSLTDPEIFWPLIEREIEARNFFLLCDSAAARASAWVQRERQAVQTISQRRSVRIGRVSLDDEKIDLAGLERFLLNLHVFVVHPVSCNPRIAFNTLETFGYSLLGAVGLSEEGLRYFGDGSAMSNDLIDTLHYGAAKGWVLVILNGAMAASPGFLAELPRQRVMFVLTEPVDLPGAPAAAIIDGVGSLGAGLTTAAQRMLEGGSG